MHNSRLPYQCVLYLDLKWIIFLKQQYFDILWEEMGLKVVRWSPLDPLETQLGQL